MQMDTNC